MNPLDVELYDSPSSGSVADVFTCRACGRFCQCTVLEGRSAPYSCPCGEAADWCPVYRRVL